jgi:hypothetical protein
MFSFFLFSSFLAQRKRRRNRMTCADDDSLTVLVKPLNSCIVCPICRGYFRDAHTIAECLHTFCKTCIVRHFAPHNAIEEHRCPVCNTHAGSNPLSALRQDRTVQAVVDHLFPHFAEHERAAELEFYRSRGLPLPSETPEQRRATPGPALRRTRDGEVRLPSVTRLLRGGGFYGDPVTLKLVRGEGAGLADLAKPFVRSSGRATVLHVLKLVA